MNVQLIVHVHIGPPDINHTETGSIVRIIERIRSRGLDGNFLVYGAITEEERPSYAVVFHGARPSVRDKYTAQLAYELIFRAEAASLGSHSTSAAPSMWFTQRLQTNIASLRRFKY